MKVQKRSYHVADATMLVAAATIVDSAIAHKALLQAKRSVWEGPFFENLKEDIESVIRKHLGVDGAKALRDATSTVKEHFTTAGDLLSEVRVQIEADYMDDKARRNEILTHLGFKAYYKTAKNGNNEDMLQLLAHFATNMDAELRQELVANGIHPETILKLIKLSEAFRIAEVKQEGLKGSKKEITAEGLAAFNDVYKRVMGVSKIAASFLKEQPVVQQQFSFRKVAGVQSFKPSKPDVPDTDASISVGS